MAVRRINRRQTGAAQASAVIQRFLVVAEVEETPGQILVRFYESVEGETEPIADLYSGVLKLNPGPLIGTIGEAATYVTDIEVNNGGAGGAAQIAFTVSSQPTTPNFLVIPANWPTVRSVVGHFIAPTLLTI